VASTSRSQWMEFPHIDWGFKWNRTAGILKWNAFRRRSDQNSECTGFLYRSTFLMVRIVSRVLSCFCEELSNQATDFLEIWPERCSVEFPLIVLLLRAFVKLRKAAVSAIMFVCPPVFQSAWINSAGTGMIFVNLILEFFFESLPPQKIKFNWNLTRDQPRGLVVRTSVY
jgi:hypothetical protein